MHADYTLDLVNSARIVNMTDAAAVAASSSLYVGNLPLLTTQSILQTFCHGAGCPSVYSINLHKNKNKAIESGYGFVHFRDHDSARIAFALLENKTMGENRLVVNWSFGKGGTKANKNPPIAKNQWQCPDPSCGTINSDQKESCVKCNMPSKIKVAQRKPNTFLSKPASKECNQSQTASFLPTPATVPSTTTGGRGRGQKAQARLAMLRQPKPDSDNGIGKTSGDRIQHLEQTLATSRSSVNMDHHLIAVFRLRKELKKNRLLALSHRSSQLVEAATTALTRSSEYCTQGGRLLEDYQRLKKEISFYLKWKSEVDTGKDESLAAMKEMAFNGAAKGLSKSVEKYLADFPQDDMKDVLTQVDESLGTILKNHEFLVKSNAKEWDMKSIGGDDAAVEKIAYSSKDDFYALTTAFATMKRALEEEEEKQTDLPKLDELVPRVRKSMQSENDRLCSLHKSRLDENSELSLAVGGLKWARQRLLSLFTSYEKIYQLALELEQRHGSDAIAIAGKEDQIPTYVSLSIDTRPVEEKFAKLSVDEARNDDSLSERANFSDAEELQEVDQQGEIITVEEVD